MSNKIAILDRKSYIKTLEIIFDELEKERERHLRNEAAARRDGRPAKNGDASDAVWDCITKIQEMLKMASKSERSLAGHKLINLENDVKEEEQSQ